MQRAAVHLSVVVAACSVISSGAGWTPPRAGGTFNERAILRASDAQNFDRFGGAVAISDDTAIVGANGEDGGPGDPASFAGAAYVFDRDEGGAGNWGQVARLAASDLQFEDFFGDAVAIHGNTAIVGAPGEDGGAGDPLAEAGAAYVFEFFEGFGWLQVAKLTASDAGTLDFFGTAVAVSGDTAVVGASLESGGPGDPLSQAGAVYVFGRDEGGENDWGEVTKLAASDLEQGDTFGSSVAISGDTLVVGSPNERGGPGNPLMAAGAAYVFEFFDGFGWLEVVKLTASDAQEFNEFGSSVAISGGDAVVGARQPEVVDGAGAAYVFGRDEGGMNHWGEVTRLTAPDAQSDDEFGISVALSGDTVVVGAQSEDGGPGDPFPGAGAAYVFQSVAGAGWHHTAKLTASDPGNSDNFGRSVAISAGTAVIGTPDDEAAHVFRESFLQIFITALHEAIAARTPAFGRCCGYR